MSKELDSHYLQCREELSNILQFRFGESGLSLTELSSICSLDRGVVSRVLNNRQPPSTKTLDLMVNALNIAYEEHMFLEALAGRIHPSVTKDYRHLMAKDLSRSLRTI